jgi:SAM-dependent methyltransferase
MELTPVESPSRQPLRECVDFLMGRNVETILDAGCGNGEAALFLAERGFVVEGFDPDPQLAARAQQAADRRRLVAEFKPGRFDAIPFELELFDAVVAFLTLDCITPRELAMAIDWFGRHVRRGGSLFALFHPYAPQKTEGYPIAYRDNELRRMFLDFQLMQFQSYSGGYRGLFFRR